MQSSGQQQRLSAYSVAHVPRGVVLPCRSRAHMKLLAPNRTRGWLLHHRVRRPLQEPRGRQMFDVGRHCIGRRRPVPQRSGDQQRDEADEWQKPMQRQPSLFGGIALGHGALSSLGKITGHNTAVNQKGAAGLQRVVTSQSQARSAQCVRAHSQASRAAALAIECSSASLTAAFDASLAGMSCR